VLRQLRRLPGVEIRRLAPRYYPELAWVMRLPGLREFLAWNCTVLLARTGPPRPAPPESRPAAQ
jgi:hypothetical protein